MELTKKKKSEVVWRGPTEKILTRGNGGEKSLCEVRDLKKGLNLTWVVV